MSIKIGKSAEEFGFEGFQSETRAIEALQLRIDYQTPRWPYKSQMENGEWLLRTGPLSRPASVRKTTNLDPYAIRNAFDQVANIEEAARFLSEAGRFWAFETVSWNQFQEWQRFFRFLRLGPEAGRRTAEGGNAWDTAQGMGSKFFAQSDEHFTHSRFPSFVPREEGPAQWRKIVIQDRQMLSALRKFALHPEGPHLQARISLAWYDASDPHAPEDWTARRSLKIKHHSRCPYLQVEAHYVIEAVAATIYADIAQGVRYGRCKQCLRFFKIESAHGQEFCAAPAHLRSSPCKNAYLQFQRRMNEKRAIAFLMHCQNEGLSKTEIPSRAGAQGIHLTPAITAKAHEKRSKHKKSTVVAPGKKRGERK